MREIHVMLKPASGLCNMQCRYCFYADETSKRNTANFGIMSFDTLHSVLEKVLREVTHSCTIAFQGGEPTLAGLSFFRQAVSICKGKNVNRCKISFALQTNGLLIDDEWCEFLAENHFLVGISLDGPKELHDANRIDTVGKGTYSRVMHALQLLKSHGIDTNILTVVTADTAKNYRKAYNFFTRSGFDYQQYIPCLDPLDEPRGKQPWSLTPEQFEKYLKTAFDCWYQDAMRGQKRYHRYFDNLLLMLNGQLPEACGMLGICGMQYVVEADGSVYPCDFYMLDQYRLGNFNTDTLAQIDTKRKEIGFVEQSCEKDKKCKTCRWYQLCRGGCRRDRDYYQDGIGRNYYCTAYAHFFEYAWPKFGVLYEKMMRGRL
nr:anaerobic sulfatase maturase [Ruthenibacterium lactatiformans]